MKIMNPVFVKIQNAKQQLFSPWHLGYLASLRLAKEWNKHPRLFFIALTIFKPVVYLYFSYKNLQCSENE